MTTTYTIDILSSLFARYGDPEVIVSDNGAQFTSAAFREFCTERGIDHIRTAPHHPQSNGQAERFVDTFKRALTKYEEGGETIVKYLDSFLKTYRATPNRSAPDGKSPSELFIGRRIRTTLDLLLPNDSPTTPQPDERTAQQYNRRHGARSKTFTAGDAVFVQKHVLNKNLDWIPGKVIERIGNVMYNVAVTDARRNTLVRVHVDQMRPRSTTDSPTQPSHIPLATLLDILEVPHQPQHRPALSTAPTPT